MWPTHPQRAWAALLVYSMWQACALTKDILLQARAVPITKTKAETCLDSHTTRRPLQIGMSCTHQIAVDVDSVSTLTRLLSHAQGAGLAR